MGQLEDWVNAVDHHLAQLKHLLPDDFPLDFSSASLQRLELVAIERYDSLEALGGDDGADGFLQGVLAYVGEAVLRVVGGSWMWDDGDKHGATSHPVILLDERLGFPAMSVAPPYLLLVDALETRDGKAFERVYSSMQEVAQERRAEDPSWTPMRKPRPTSLPPPHGHLKAARDPRSVGQRLPQWAWSCWAGSSASRNASGA